MSLTEDILQIWADLFPIQGYAAGLSSCQGRILLPTPENKQVALEHINAAEQRLGESADPDLQATAAKLLFCFRINLELESYRPHQAVNTCAEGIRYILLKKEQQAPFVAEYLENLRQILKLEIKRWQVQQLSRSGGQRSWICVCPGPRKLNFRPRLPLRIAP